MKYNVRIVVSGTRDYPEKYSWVVYDALKLLRQGRTLIAHGGATGLDELAGKMARKLKLQVAVSKADWSKFGVGAGPVRNRKLLRMVKPTFVVAFFASMADLEKSKGTRDMLNATFAIQKAFPIVTVHIGWRKYHVYVPTNDRSKMTFQQSMVLPWHRTYKLFKKQQKKRVKLGKPPLIKFYRPRKRT